MRRLKTYVWVNGEHGPVAFGPDDDVPKWAAEQMGPHCFEGDSDSDGDGPPPQAGKGSGKDVWIAYAAGLGVQVDDGATRDDIVAAVAAAGHPVE